MVFPLWRNKYRDHLECAFKQSTDHILSSRAKHALLKVVELGAHRPIGRQFGRVKMGEVAENQFYDRRKADQRSPGIQLPAKLSHFAWAKPNDLALRFHRPGQNEKSQD